MALEPVHAVVYFDEACRTSMADLGLHGFWMGYFAGRAAPLGPVGPDIVAACFFNFSPGMVARSLPDAWAIAPPTTVWGARRAGAASTLRRVAPDIGGRAADAVPLLARAVAAASGAGRPLFAATRASGWPDDPVEALWHACTCLREHRGDGHVAALTASGLDGIEALVLFSASEGLAESLFLAARGWSEGEWADAAERLASRGLLDAHGISADGAGLRRSVESMTDHQAALPFAALSEVEQQQLRSHLGTIGTAVHAAGVLDYPNPMGLPEPSRT
jgi:hypothetical protein